MSSDVIVNEGEEFWMWCDSGNFEAVTAMEVIDPRRMSVSRNNVGLFYIERITRSFAGTYTCVVTSMLTNATANDTSVIIIQCELIVND